MLSRKRRASDAVAVAHERVRELTRTALHVAPSPSYLDRRVAPSERNAPLISERQREVVVKYVNELAEDFELCVQTGTLACNYFDRYVAYLSRTESAPAADKRLIQMIASTCLLIAAKFSDRKLPPLSELEKVHHGKASADEFAQLELQILQGLRWKLHVPLPHVFTEHLKALCAGAPFTPAIEDRMHFFIDLSVYGYHFLAYTPAAIAAASILTAWKFSDEHECVQHHIGSLARAVSIPPHQLSTCVNALVRYYQSCFPESAEKASQSQSLFIPIHEDSDASSPVPSQADTPTLLRRDAPTLVGEPSPRQDSSSSIGSLPPTPTEEAPPPGTTTTTTNTMKANAPTAGAKPQQPYDPERRTPDSILDVAQLS